MTLQSTKIRTLHIPYDDYPSYLYDTYPKLKSYIFKDDATYIMQVSSSFSYILSCHDFANLKKQNLCATNIYRAYNHLDYRDIIYGDVLVIGQNYSSIADNILDSLSYILGTK